MIVTVIDIKARKEYQIEARSNGENAIKCPVCADERKKKSVKSMTFNGQKGIGHCHHCDARFVEKGHNRDQMPSAPKEYVRPVWTNVTTLSENLVKWFKARGIGQQTLIDLKITEGPEWMPQVQKEMNCVKFNYFRGGELVNTKYRTGKKQFKLVSGAELIFYNLDAIKGAEECVVVEGEIDCASFHEVGITKVVSVPNGASKGARLEYLDNCWDHFDGMKKIFIGTDNDEAGRLLRDELARRLGKERCKIIDYGKYKDANEVLVNDKLLLSELKEQAKDYPIEGIFDLDSLEQQVLDITKNGLEKGDSISIESFNRLLTWVPGYVTIITGVPNHGKGEFLDQIIIDLAHYHGWPFGIYSPENHPLALHVIKFASKALALSSNNFTPTDIRNFITEFRNRLFFIMPPDDLTLDSILESARILVKKYGIKGLVIDPWNKLDHQFDGSETQYISRALDQIDLFARKYGVHVFVVAHPAKLLKDRDSKKIEVPTPYSISGSAHWYNKPANCITVYRTFFDEGVSNTTVYVQKVKFKHWGGQGEVTLNYNFSTGRYYTVGYENKQPYVNTNGQTHIEIPPAQIKPNLNFSEPLKEQNEDDYSHLDPNEEPPF